MSEDAVGLEDIRSTLIDIVSDGLKSRPDGVHLTYLGSEFARRKNAPFEQYLNVLAIQRQIAVPISSRKMIPFIENYCGDILELDRTSGKAETVRVKNLAPGEAVGEISFSNHKFHKSVWAAFIRPLSEGYRRFLNIDSLGFSDLKRKPNNGVWIEIPDKFITPTPLNEPVSGPLIQAHVGEWALANNIEIEVLVDDSKKAAFDRPRIMDLLDIIDDLPTDMVARWMIPAEVLLHLNKKQR